MPTCREATRLISNGLDRSLSWPERFRLGVHVLKCGPCANFRRAVHWLHQVLGSFRTDARLPAEARSRIRRALEQAAQDE